MALSLVYRGQARDKCGKCSNAYSDIAIQSHPNKQETHRDRPHYNECHNLSDSPQSHKHQPAELLDGAHINDSVVKVVHKLWHVLVQEPLVCMHRVACKEEESWEMTRGAIQLSKKKNHRSAGGDEKPTHQPGDTVQAECAV